MTGAAPPDRSTFEKFMHRWLLLTALTALTGCGQAIVSPEVTAQPVREPPSATMARSGGAGSHAGGLAGRWRVAQIDGQTSGDAGRLVLAADENQLWWEPRCAGIVRTYRILGPGIRFVSGQVSPDTPPAPVCEIGLPSRLHDVTRALDDAVAITFVTREIVLISGPEHTLTLYSQ